MLTANLQVNGAMIGHLYIVNREKTPAGARYSYEYYEPDKPLTNGSVRHNPDNGALELIRLIIADIQQTT